MEVAIIGGGICGLSLALNLQQRGITIVSKLDRLSRDVHFISGLMKHRVPFIVTSLARTQILFCCTSMPRLLRRNEC